MLGAVIGLIAVHGKMEDTDTPGHAISAALLLRFLVFLLDMYYGIRLRTNLKRKSKQGGKSKVYDD